MKPLIFEQIGCACTRFRLEHGNMIFEVNSYQGKSWIIEGSRKDNNGHPHVGWTRIKITGNPTKFYHTIKLAIQAIVNFIENHYKTSVVWAIGCNDYPSHTKEVFKFCNDNKIPFGIPNTVSFMLEDLDFRS
jgi:hypothetical protein